MDSFYVLVKKIGDSTFKADVVGNIASATALITQIIVREAITSYPVNLVSKHIHSSKKKKTESV